MKLCFDKLDGLLPVIIQSAESKEVLMLGFMNEAALHATMETGYVVFYSRSKNRLWKKGESSGNILLVEKILPDCDQDSLLILVRPQGPTCHLLQNSCFGEIPSGVIEQLEKLLAVRYQERPAGHYTSKLFDEGVDRVAQKIGEEGVEVALAAVKGEQNEIVNEIADLIFHILVLLQMTNLAFDQILHELSQRFYRVER